MDSYDASKMILTRIHSVDPENASKIMGYILIQDLGDKELIRLAHGPETLLLSLINQAKSFFRLSSNMHSTNQNGRHFLQFPSPKMVSNTENNGFHPHLKSPVLSSSPSSPWSNTSNGVSAFSRKSSISAFYAAVANGGQSNANITPKMACGSSRSSLSLGMGTSNANLASDEFRGNFPVQDHLSFTADDSMNYPPIMSPSERSDSILWNYDDHSTVHHNSLHRRSCSVNDDYLFDDIDGAGQDSNFLGGWKPCMYYARGFCKNGNSCKFSHTCDASAADLSLVGSPNNMDDFDWLRMRAIRQQKFATASELMASSPRCSFPYKRSSAAASIGEESHKFGFCRPDMNNSSGMGLDFYSSSLQIYLTFPADSAFAEDDVSNYFSMYGPVQDVRIPYQQKRMFGFVTFVYSETVNLILAKGNPHFVCDCRVLVKPYKEKGKVAEKKHQQQLLDRGESPACLSPTGFDAREPSDLPFGGRTLYNAKEIMLKNKLEEQAELQQAIELQGRRLMSMNLMDLRNKYNTHQSCPSFPPAFPLTSRHQSCPSFPPAFPSTSRLQSHRQMFHDIFQASGGVDIEVQEGDTPANVVNEKDAKEISEASNDNIGCAGGIQEAKVSPKDADLEESLENILPDNFFASPTKTFTEHRSPDRVPTETDANIATVLSSSNYKAVLSPASTTLGTADSAKSCHFQMPRFLSGQAVVEM